MKKITLKDCKHIKELSFYNHNIYKLPFEIFGCTHLLSEYCDNAGFLGFSIGIILNSNGYIKKLYLHVGEKDKLINLEEISINNRWT